MRLKLLWLAASQNLIQTLGEEANLLQPWAAIEIGNTFRGLNLGGGLRMGRCAVRACRGWRWLLRRLLEEARLRRRMWRGQPGKCQIGGYWLIFELHMRLASRLPRLWRASGGPCLARARGRLRDL